MSDHKIGNSSAEGEPDLKRCRLLDAGGPIPDDETARRKMREAEVGEDGEITGFDPDNVDGIKRMDGIGGATFTGLNQWDTLLKRVISR